MRNEWKAIKTLLQQSCCKKKWLWSAAFICLGIVWKILSLSGRPEVAEDFSPLFFAVAGIMPMEILLVNDISGFVKGSVLRKKIQTTMATKSMFAGTMIAYLMYLAFLMILGSVREGQPEVYLRPTLVYGVGVCFLGIVNVFLYKFFWASLAGIYVICFSAGFAMGLFEDQIDFAGYWEKLSPVGCVIAAVFLIFAGCAINLVM
ncbi:MAG: hypothetical protein ACLTSD_10715, partial [Eubacterium sp.]